MSQSECMTNSLRTIFGALEGSFLPSADRVDELIRSSSERRHIFTREDTWCLPSSCRWDSPSWYRRHYILARVPEYESLKTFFVDFLSVPVKPGTDDYLEYISSYLKTPSSVEKRHKILKLLYDQLHLEIKEDSLLQKDIK
jgi:hypothetical protein